MMDSISKLGELLADAPTTIEIIPGNGQEWLESFPDNVHAPFLFVEGNLGIPEKILYKLYMAAVSVLGEPNSYLKRLQSDHSSNRKDALALSSIILLANPAHQTAMNIRKVLVLGDDPGPDETDDIVQRCTTELQFTAALLSVKQCAKVSILWHHRRSLLSRIHRSLPRSRSMDHTKYECTYNSCFTDDCFVIDANLPPSTLQIEFDIVSRACEVYPRNYHAWNHRSLCLQSCLATYQSRAHPPSTRSFIHSVNIPAYDATSVKAPVRVQTSEASDARPSFPTADLETVLKKEVTNVRAWIERHVSDYSAADYICRVAEALDDPPDLDRPKITFECMQHALGLVLSYPSHESLWVYLRQTLHILLHTSRSSSPSSFAHPGSNSSPIIPSPNIPQVIHDAESTAKRLLTQASQKCLPPRSPDPGAGADPSTTASTPQGINTETHTTIRHALRFLLWLRQVQTKYVHDGSDRKISNTTTTDDRVLASACPHFISTCSSSSAKEKSAVDLLRLISSVE